MEKLDTLLSTISRWLSYLATTAVALLTSFVVLSAFMRYLLGTPFHFTEELVGLLFLSTVFLPLAYGSSEKQHIKITMLTRLLPPKGQVAADIFGLLVIIAFATWFAIEAYQFTAFAHEIGARSEQSELLLTPWMAIMPLSLGLVALVSIVQLVRILLSFVGSPMNQGSSSQ